MRVFGKFCSVAKKERLVCSSGSFFFKTIDSALCAIFRSGGVFRLPLVSHLSCLVFGSLCLSATSLERMPFAVSGPFDRESTNAGYLARAASADDRATVAFSTAKEEQAGTGLGAAPRFSDFLKEMEARAARELAEQKLRDEGQPETGAKVGTVDGSSLAASVDPESSAGSQDTQGSTPDRQIIASTGTSSGSRYVFPRPERDPVNLENLFLYFPIQNGEMQMLGLNLDLENTSQFVPPQPMMGRSSALLEEIRN